MEFNNKDLDFHYLLDAIFYWYPNKDLNVKNILSQLVNSLQKKDNNVKIGQCENKTCLLNVYLWTIIADDIECW